MKSVRISSRCSVLNKMQQAHPLFKKSCELETPLSCARLARMYQKGIVIDKDIQKALELYLHSTELGSRYGIFQLAMLYKQGNGVAKDREKYRYWLARSAELGLKKSETG
ncbi:MAG: sel1 repeat family protein [Gammaproteobacteria bacterium]|nr:sel1 repeat family protein [Gammaproteobacteria bacterium]